MAKLKVIKNFVKKFLDLYRKLYKENPDRTVFFPALVSGLYVILYGGDQPQTKELPPGDTPPPPKRP